MVTTTWISILAIPVGLFLGWAFFLNEEKSGLKRAGAELIFGLFVSAAAIVAIVSGIIAFFSGGDRLMVMIGLVFGLVCIGIAGHFLDQH